MFGLISLELYKQAMPFAKEMGVATDYFGLLKHRDKKIGYTIKLDFNSFYVNLTYRIKQSILYCTFEPKNEPLGLEYLFYDIVVLADIADFRPTVFAFTADRDDTKTALGVIFGVIKDNLPEIRSIFESPERVRELRLAKTEEMKQQLDCDIFSTASELDESSVREEYLSNTLELYKNIELSRYCQKRYGEFLDGSYKKALKGYKNKKYNSAYETRICSFLETEPAPRIYPNFVKAGLDAQGGKREFLPLFVCWILLSIPLSAVYIALYYKFISCFDSGAVYNTALEPYNSANCVLLAFVTAIALSYFLRRFLIRMFGKNKEKRLAYDKIFNTGKTVRLMKYFFITVAGASVVFAMLFANTNLAFYNTKLVDNGGIFELAGTEYRYSDITEAYECEGITNALGDWVEGKHLVLRFKGGTEINTYLYAENENIEKLVYPVLEENGIEIKKVKELK